MATKKPVSNLRALALKEVFVDWNDNPRGTSWGKDDDKEFQSLKKSVKDSYSRGNPYGIVNSISVQPVSTIPGYKYKLVSGYRRFRCMQEIYAEKKGTKRINAWASKIPALVKVTSDDSAATVSALYDALAENQQRAAMDTYAEAEALQYLLTAEDISTKELAKKINKSLGYVAQRISILSIGEDVREKATAAGATMSQLRSISTLDVKQQLSVVSKIAKGLSSGRETQEYIASLKKKERDAKETRTVSIKPAVVPTKPRAKVPVPKTADTPVLKETVASKASAAASKEVVDAALLDDEDDEDATDESPKAEALQMTASLLSTLASNATQNAFRLMVLGVLEWEKYRAGNKNSVFAAVRLDQSPGALQIEILEKMRAKLIRSM